MNDVSALLAAYATCRTARMRFLESLGCASNRDPLAEFSEILVAALTSSRRAGSRVQKDWDLVGPEGQKTQVRHLANPPDSWVNEHLVCVTEGLDRYALVVFEGFEPKAVLSFPATALGSVCAALRKRHPKQDKTLQFTRANFREILENRSVFQRLGVEIFSPVVPLRVSQDGSGG